MNRVIKFRARRTDNKMWVYGHFFKTPLTAEFDAKNGNYFSSGEERYCISHEYGVAFEIDPNTLGQYTELTDKNGKEIYEGDIVKCGYGVGVVLFNAGCFMVEWIDDKESNMEFLFSRKGTHSRSGDYAFEVIGNKFENPELLK